MEISLIPKEKIEIILPLLEEIDASLDGELLAMRLDEMVQNGYECAGIFVDDVLVGICGLWTLYKYYVGKHIEPDNVYIKPAWRSSGVGKALVSWLTELAESRDCQAIELNCYKENLKGNEFWLSNGFLQIGNHYQLRLK